MNKDTQGHSLILYFLLSFHRDFAIFFPCLYFLLALTENNHHHCPFLSIFGHLQHHLLPFSVRRSSSLHHQLQIFLFFFFFAIIVFITTEAVAVVGAITCCCLLLPSNVHQHHPPFPFWCQEPTAPSPPSSRTRVAPLLPHLCSRLQWADPPSHRWASTTPGELRCTLLVG